MSVRFAINGLGRVGRALVRIAAERPGLEWVAANDNQGDARQIARLLLHDTVHGRYPGAIGVADRALVVDGRRVPLFAEHRPEDIPWQSTGARIVLEATGRFRARADAAGHLRSAETSVARVVISATASDADATFCFGINHRTFDPARHRVVSNASCTTNCLAPVLLVLDRHFGVERALMNTVHCMTNSQNLVDMAHPDPRRARAAAANIIPTTSDAIPSIGLVLPAMADRVEGLAMRVPVIAGSLIDVTARLGRDAPLDEVAGAFRAAANGDLAAILAVTDEQLVSSDFIGDPHSATVDLPLLQRAGERLVRVVAWYDNEWGYAHRLADLIEFLGKEGHVR